MKHRGRRNSVGEKSVVEKGGREGKEYVEGGRRMQENEE